LHFSRLELAVLAAVVVFDVAKFAVKR